MDNEILIAAMVQFADQNGDPKSAKDFAKWLESEAGKNYLASLEKGGGGNDQEATRKPK